MDKTKAQLFSERLIKAMLSKGYTAQRKNESGVDVKLIAEKLKITYEMARRYTLGQAIPNDDKLSELSDWLRVDCGWLKTGTLSLCSNKQTDQILNVPIIPDTQVVEWLENPDKSHCAHFFPTFDLVSEKAFAINVEDNAVFRENDFLVGGHIIMIADPAEPLHDLSLVLVKFKNNPHVTLKILWEEEGTGKRILKSLSSRFPPIEISDDCKILAKVVSSYHSYK